MIQMAHAVAILCYYVSEFMTKKGFKVFGGALMLLKIFSYFYSHFTL